MMKTSLQYSAALVSLCFVVNLAQGQTSPNLTASPTALIFTFAQGAPAPPQQTIVISAAYAASITVTYPTASGGNWLTVLPAQGITPASLTVQINPFSSGLAAGTYTGSIIVSATGQTLTIPVTLNVTTTLTLSAAGLSFNLQQGASPSVQTVSVNAGASVTFAANASSVGNWLSVQQSKATTPGTVAVFADPNGLAPGTYMGSVSVSSPSAPTIALPVTLAVTPIPVLNSSPGSLFFQTTSAQPQPSPQTISVFGNVPSQVFASVVTGNSWLSVTPSAGQTPAVLTVSVNPANLIPGTYAGQIGIAPTRTQTPSLIPVTYIVAAPQPATLQAAPDNISLSTAQGGLPIQTGISIANPGGTVLNFTAQAVAPWLSLGVTSGSVGAGASVVLPITVTPGSLLPATYTAPITITAGAQTASPLIVLAVNSQGPSLQLSQTGLAFRSVSQGANPPPQSVSVVNTGSGSLNWNVTTATLSGGNAWLSATPGSGSTQPLPATPTALTVSVNSQNLPPGTYYGSVTVNSQVLSVQATVVPAGQQVQPLLSTNGLVYTANAGANPLAQSVSIYNLNQSTWPAITSSTDDGVAWLSVTTPNGVPSGPSASISIQAALAALSPGVRTGTIRLAFSDGSVQAIGVTSVVAPSGTSPQALGGAVSPLASGSCPSRLIPQITSPAQNFNVSAGQSVPLTVMVVDDCGHALPNSISSSVIASFYDASKPTASGKLRADAILSPQGNGVWAGTWTPQNGIAQIQVIIVALGILGTNPIAGQTQYVGTVQPPAAGAPALPTGIFNAASYQPGNIVALGSFVSIFGSGMANGSAAPSTQPLPVALQGTQVFLGGIPLPLQFAGPTQINALIPASVAVNSKLPLIVQRDSTQAAPTSVTVADSQPGIYTANQQGTGQGAVLTGDNALAAPTGAFPGAHPAARGQVIQIFCTGLGAVSNPPVAGAAAPISPLSITLNKITATIGGVDAPVTFAGLAPGFIGLYQVNANVPLSVPVGNAITLTLSTGTATSNAATIAIQ